MKEDNNLTEKVYVNMTSGIIGLWIEREKKYSGTCLLRSPLGRNFYVIDRWLL